MTTDPFALCPEGARLLKAAGESVGMPGIEGMKEGSDHERE